MRAICGDSVERAALAQLVERLIRNQQVAGSIPAGGSINSITYRDFGIRVRVAVPIFVPTARTLCPDCTPYDRVF